tara:strand:+ start:746 stop:988 length:243 start_codon:yes stop_codon:yes gene_type:complete
MFKNIKAEEILVYLMLIVVGYYIAKMFSRSCNGFSVGGPTCAQTFSLSPDINLCDNKEPIQNPNSVTYTNPNNFIRNCCQ